MGEGSSMRDEALDADRLTAAFALRRCCRRGCNAEVVLVLVGQEAIRAPGGILIARGRVDRNYCEKHAARLIAGKIVGAPEVRERRGSP
jgi:hypothetical protein